MMNANDLTLTVLKVTASWFCPHGTYAHQQWVVVWLKTVTEPANSSFVVV